MFYALVKTKKQSLFVSAQSVKEIKYIKRILCPYCEREVYLVEGKYFRHKKGTCPFAEKNTYNPTKEALLKKLKELELKDWIQVEENELTSSIPDFFLAKEKNIAVFVDSREPDWKSCLNLRIHTKEEEAIEMARKEGVGYWFDQTRNQLIAIREQTYIPIKHVERIFYYRNQAHLIRFMKLLEEKENTITIQIGQTQKEIDKKFKILCYGK